MRHLEGGATTSFNRGRWCRRHAQFPEGSPERRWHTSPLCCAPKLPDLFVKLLENHVRYVLLLVCGLDFPDLHSFEGKCSTRSIKRNLQYYRKYDTVNCVPRARKRTCLITFLSHQCDMAERTPTQGPDRIKLFQLCRINNIQKC